ncbi:hypothetical protein BHQ23_31120 [Mycobacterium gordonae]|nr:hypothetical protein BHQ23_31120 [Mycobacterium gordonae]
MQDVEDGQQLLFGSVAQRGGPLLDQAVRPEQFAPLEHGQDQLVLGREVPIERRLGHRGTLDHFLSANRPDSTPAEQFIGGIQYPFAGGHRGPTGARDVGRCHNVTYRTLTPAM